MTLAYPSIQSSRENCISNSSIFDDLQNVSVTAPGPTPNFIHFVELFHTAPWCLFLLLQPFSTRLIWAVPNSYIPEVQYEVKWKQNKDEVLYSHCAWPTLVRSAVSCLAIILTWGWQTRSKCGKSRKTVHNLCCIPDLILWHLNHAEIMTGIRLS